MGIMEFHGIHKMRRDPVSRIIKLLEKDWRISSKARAEDYEVWGDVYIELGEGGTYTIYTFPYGIDYDSIESIFGADERNLYFTAAPEPPHWEEV